MEDKLFLFHPRTFHTLNYSSFWLPYSILSVGSHLSKKMNVTLFDNNIQNNNIDAISDFIIDSNISFLGISTMIGHQLLEGLQLARCLKSKHYDIPIIFGGAAPTMLSKEILLDDSVDFVIKGQGEQTLDELLSSLNNSSSLELIDGLLYKTQSNEIISNKNRLVFSREHFQRYDFSLINVQNYIQNDPKIASKTINYIASQGCPFNCGFCSDTNLFDRKWTGFDAEMIVEDILSLKENYGVNGIKFYDSNFIINKNLTEQFALKLIDLDANIAWGSAIHPATFITLEDSFLDMLSKSGCKRLLIGAESGNQEVLDLVGKKLTPSDMVSIAQKASNYDISISFTAIVGFPEVPDSHYDETFELGKRLRTIDNNHEVKIHIYAPYPMTSLYSVALRNGFKPPSTLEEWSNYDYYSTQTSWISKNMEQKVRNFNLKHSSSVNRV